MIRQLAIIFGCLALGELVIYLTGIIIGMFFTFEHSRNAAVDHVVEVKGDTTGMGT